MTVPYDMSIPALPARPEESHKGTFGSVLIVAGSRGMSGAACLAGLGALRGGAGLVTVAVPAGIQGIVAGTEPSYLTVALPEDDQGRISRHATADVLARAQHATAVAIGPGWGKSPDLIDLAHLLYTQVERPLVVDADALNALASSPAGFRKGPPGVPRIVTPHPGEFARLLTTPTKAVQHDRETVAADFAREHGAIIVLKGHGTVITDGEKTAINTTGNSGMATGGTGDVLTGIITARWLGPTDRGLFNLLVLLPTVLSNFVKLGIPQASVYYMRRKNVPASDVASNSLWFAITMGSALAIICWFGRDWLLANVLKQAPESLVAPTLILVPCVLLQFYFLGVAQAQDPAAVETRLRARTRLRRRRRQWHQEGPLSPASDRAGCHVLRQGCSRGGVPRLARQSDVPRLRSHSRQRRVNR
jgi:NAD(P)H-hydrate epimerase